MKIPQLYWGIIINQKQTKVFNERAKTVHFKTNKEKGNMGLGMAIAYYTSKGYIVFQKKR